MAKKSVQDQMDEILADFVNEEQETIEKTFDSVAKLTKKKLVEVSPKDKGDYAKGWTVTKDKKSGAKFGPVGVVIHNKKHYRLTHLLEKSHQIRNQYGTYGRSKAQPHISKAEEWGVNELMKELESKL